MMIPLTIVKERVISGQNITNKLIFVFFCVHASLKSVADKDSYHQINNLEL